MKKLLMVLSGIALYSVSASAATSANDVKQELVGLYPMSNIAMDDVTSYTPDKLGLTCLGLGGVSNEIFHFTGMIQDAASDPAGAPIAGSAATLNKLAMDLGGFCGGSGSVAKGSQKAAVAQMTAIKQQLDADWKVLFPEL
jgi:hypothetical protein